MKEYWARRVENVAAKADAETLLEYMDYTSECALIFLGEYAKRWLKILRRKVDIVKYFILGLVS